MKIANAIGLTVTAILMVGFIMTRPVPAAHTKVECIPIGAAAEAQPEYERVGNWVIRR
jgi:hypothetical protein